MTSTSAVDELDFKAGENGFERTTRTTHVEERTTVVEVLVEADGTIVVVKGPPNPGYPWPPLAKILKLDIRSARLLSRALDRAADKVAATEIAKFGGGGGC